MASLVNSTKHLKNSNFSLTLLKNRGQGTLPNLLCAASITSILKVEKGITRTENHRPLSFMKSDAKILSKKKISKPKTALVMG